jgi:6-phosphogluconolactonase (cycloisomerase 2 family)
LTLSGSFPPATTPASLAVLGSFLYVANRGSGSISAFSVAPSTGVLTEITNSPFTAPATPSFMVIDPNGLFLYIGSQSADSISAFSINTSTGALTNTAQLASTTVSPSAMSVSK